MNFVDKENVVRLEVGQNRRQVARTFENGAGGLTKIDAHFVRNDMRERRLAEPRRTE